MLVRDNHLLCLESNGNLLHSYLLWGLTENNEKAKKLFSTGAHTLREQRHFYLFSAVHTRVKKETVLDCIMQRFTENAVKPSSALLAFAALKDNLNHPKIHVFKADIDKKIKELSCLRHSPYESEVLSILIKNNQIERKLETNPKRFPLRGGLFNKKNENKFGLKRKKVAILISGQFRGKKITESCQELIDEIRAIYETDVYISTWELIGNSSW